MKPIKKHGVIFAVAFLLWLITFYTDTKIFTHDPLNMNCLPIDTGMISFMHLGTKIFSLLFLIGLFEFLTFYKSKPRQFLLFLGLLAIYFIGLVFTYPGYYMSDDPIIFAYATRYYPVYWHCYLTSLFYMVGISLIPASCGPVVLSDILYAMVFTYLYDKTMETMKSKWANLIILSMIAPFTLLGALMCFRPAVYSSFFLFYFSFLYFEWKEKKPLTPLKLFILSLLTAILSIWRSESIVLLPIGFILIGLAYADTKFFCKETFRKAGLFFLLSILLFVLIKIPQSHGEKTYYGNDYLIISTTRPLSVIVHRDQTYEGSEEDIENVSAITEFGYLHNDSLSCSAFNRYNSDHNEGRYTQTGADQQTQQKYLRSAFRLIAHNLDLYLGERIQLFCVTNGIFHYNKDMVLNLKPVVTTDFPLYDHDRSYGFEMLDAFNRLPIPHLEGYALFLFKFGGEAYIPMLAILFALTIFTLVKKEWFLCFSCLALCAREAVIFLTAPASFIQYSYPMMYVTLVLLLLLIIDKLTNKNTNN